MLTPATPGIAPVTVTRVPAGATTRSSRITPAGSETSTRFTLAPANVRTDVLGDRPVTGLLAAAPDRARNAKPMIATLEKPVLTPRRYPASAIPPVSIRESRIAISAPKCANPTRYASRSLGIIRKPTLSDQREQTKSRTRLGTEGLLCLMPGLIKHASVARRG